MPEAVRVLWRAGRPCINSRLQKPGASGDLEPVPDFRGSQFLVSTRAHQVTKQLQSTRYGREKPEVMDSPSKPLSTRQRTTLQRKAYCER